MIDRERRMIERRIKAAKFPAVKSLDSFDFKAIPALNKIVGVVLALGLDDRERGVVVRIRADVRREGGQRQICSLLGLLCHHLNQRVTTVLFLRWVSG